MDKENLKKKTILASDKARFDVIDQVGKEDFELKLIIVPNGPSCFHHFSIKNLYSNNSSKSKYIRRLNLQRYSLAIL